LPAEGDCPPGYHAVFAEAGGWGGYCQLNPPDPETLPLPADGDCPAGYHAVFAEAGGWGGYCQLNASNPETLPLPSEGDCPPGYHAVFAEAGGWGGYCQLNGPDPETLPLPADGDCPPGYHAVFAPAGGWGGYCQLNVAASPTSPRSLVLQLAPSATPQPQTAGASAIPELESVVDIVQFCANKAASLGGVNIAFPLESTLHVDNWFSDSPGDVKCEDDVGNPRTCWGPESAVFEALWCNTDMVQGGDYGCESLPITLGACAQERQNTREEESPDAIPPCVHC
jgi:hypothetical protein